MSRASARDGKHLLFAPRQGDALLRATLAEARKQIVEAVDGPADGRLSSRTIPPKVSIHAPGKGATP